MFAALTFATSGCDDIDMDPDFASFVVSLIAIHSQDHAAHPAALQHARISGNGHCKTEPLALQTRRLRISDKRP